MNIITQIVGRPHYYYLVSSLAELSFAQEKLPISQKDFLGVLNRDLHPSDFELVKYIFLIYDQYNLLNSLEDRKKPFDKRGIFNQEDIEALSNTKDIEPLDVASGNFYNHLKNLAIHYKNDTPFKNGLSWENQFTSQFYDFTQKSENRFLREWFTFEMNLKNIITGIVANTYSLDVNKELIGDNDITEAIKSVKAKDFGLSRDYDFAERILNLFENTAILEREKSIDLIKWETLDQMTTFFYFSIENVLAYLLKIGILERWKLLDEEKGKATFENIIKDLKKSYEFPEYFIV